MVQLPRLFIVPLGFILVSYICDSQNLPIKTSRTISFITDEGTNISLDVSPDGRSLVFDMVGELFTVPVTGGSATQLTHGLAINMRPVWSPNGKQVAYVSDQSGTLKVNVRDLPGKYHSVIGQELKLNYDLDVNWSLDGNHIISNQYLNGLEGGEHWIDYGSPKLFSKDGKYTYFISEGSLVRLDGQTDSISTIFKNLPAFRYGILSRDAKWWAYVVDSTTKGSLLLQNLLTGKIRVLVPNLLSKAPFYHALTGQPPHYSFSPDSRHLYISYGGKIHEINIANGDDKIIRFTARVEVDAGPLDYNKFAVNLQSIRVKYIRSAAASPDGKHLIFVALNKLFLMDLPNGKPHVLAAQPVNQFQPAWSPDGKWIAYVSWNDTIGGGLWRVAVAHGVPKQVTDIPGLYQHPEWSPDGNGIIAICGTLSLSNMDDPGRGQVKLFPFTGNSFKILTDTIPMWNNLAFSQDGTELFYSPKLESQDTLRPLLISKNLLTNAIKVYATGRLRYSSSYIVNRCMSPDGRFIAYSLGEDLYIVPVTSLPSPTVIYDEKTDISAIRFAMGVDPKWEENGKIISWCYGNHYYRANAQDIINAADARKGSGLSDSSVVTVTVTPKQISSININVPGQFGRGILALKNARIISMVGHQVIENGTIVIKNGRLLIVGQTSKVIIPAGATVFNLSGTTIVPGFVDVHLHLRVPTEITPQQPWSCLANLAYGVTTARDPSSDIDSYGYDALIESGNMLGPRLYTSGRAVHLVPFGIIRADNSSDIQLIAKKRQFLGGTFTKQYLLPTRLQREWLLIASKESGLNMTNEGDLDIITQLAMLKDGSTGVEHSPELGDVYKDVISVFAKSGTFLTPTLQVRYGGELQQQLNNYTYWHQSVSKLLNFIPTQKLSEIINASNVDTANKGYDYPAKIYTCIKQQGGRVLLGSHGNNEGIGVHNELWALRSGGMTNFEALQCATICGAEAIGIAKEVGSIELGKIADLIVLRKNPLEDIHNSRDILYVIKSGILYDGNTLNMLWPIVQNCPPWKLNHSNN